MAVVFGRFTCRMNRTSDNPGVFVAMRLMTHLHKEQDDVWRIAHECLVAE